MDDADAVEDLLPFEALELTIKGDRIGRFVADELGARHLLAVVAPGNFELHESQRLAGDLFQAVAFGAL